jgi:integrase
MAPLGKTLTQRIIDAAPLPETGFKELRDHGLVVRIYQSGRRSFSLEYRSPMTRKSARIALFGPTLAEARAQAAAQKRILVEGRDPAVERQEALTARRIEYARSKTVAEAVRIYEIDFTQHVKIVSRRERMAKLRRAVEPFNDRPVASLTKGELVNRLDAIQSESGPVARNRAHAEIRTWLAWLLEREHVPAIVLAGVKKRAVENARTRVLTDEELGAIARITTDGAPFSDIVRVLLHTGMRKSEAASLQARDIDFGTCTIKVRAEVSKTNRERVIPMIDAIAMMLNRRSEGRRPDVYIFGLRGDAPFSGWDAAIKRMRDATAGNDWTLHDIRRTVATRLHDAGVDPLVIEDLLGHLSGVRGGMAGVYNRSVTLAKQREALNDWAGRLATLMGDNVMPLQYTTKRGYTGR